MFIENESFDERAMRARSQKVLFFWKSTTKNIRVGNSLFRSKLLILKSDCERFALIALLKRATVSISLSSLFTKEQP